MIKKLYRALLSERRRRYIYLKYRFQPQGPSIQHVLNCFARRITNCFFIEIGSNDGVRADPIYLYVSTFLWKGIVVEPVKYLFERLQQNYKDFPGVICENLAIAKNDGLVDFYRLQSGKGELLPSYHDGLGSLYKDVVLKHRYAIPDIERYLVVEKVHALTLDHLLEKHHVHHLNLLCIDTEGYDYEIIKMIDFKKLHPEILLFEHKHLSAEDLQECLALLAEKGYGFFQEYQDTICFHKAKVSYLDRDLYPF